MDWGCNCWYSETAIAYAYPTKPTTEQQKQYKEHYTNLQNTLPCKHCRKHWAQIINDNPPDTRSRRTLTRWLYNAHNKVNDHVRAQSPLKSPNGKKPWAQTHPKNPLLCEIDAKFRAPKSKTKLSLKSMKSSTKSTAATTTTTLKTKRTKL